MEKQKFFMEILDIVQCSGSDIDQAAITLVKQVIRTQARMGNRQYNIATNFNINVNGVNININVETVRNIKNVLIEEGFTVQEYDGYYSINW